MNAACAVPTVEDPPTSAPTMMPESTLQPARRPATVNSPVDRTRQPDTSAIKAMQRVTSTTPSIIPYCTLPIPVYEGAQPLIRACFEDAQVGLSAATSANL